MSPRKKKKYTEMDDDEIMEKIFNKAILKKTKKVAEEAKKKNAKNKKPKD